MLTARCLHRAFYFPSMIPDCVVSNHTSTLYICLTTQSHEGICGEGAKEGHFLVFSTKTLFYFPEKLPCTSAVLSYFCQRVSYIKYIQKFFTACSSSDKRISNSSSVWSPRSLKDITTKKCVSWQSTCIFFKSVYLIILQRTKEIKCFLVLRL